MLGQESRAAWERDGYFVLRRFLDPAEGQAMLSDAIDLIRGAIPAGGPLQLAYEVDGAVVHPEKKPSPAARFAEDYVSRVFNVHRFRRFAEFARLPRVLAVLQDLLGADVDFFQSQLIFENPGALGQPWHRDSSHFNFDRHPEVAVRLAISRSTAENGCLLVLPGSHRKPIERHRPEGQSEASSHREGKDHDFSGAVPVLMEAGDVLFLHSFLMQRSEDNRFSSRRVALVYHYCAGSTKQIGRWRNPFVDFIPVRRGARPGRFR